jgi:hypothetical protein
MVNEPIQATAPPQSPPSTGKKRHGCLTVWIILIIILNAFGLIVDIALRGTTSFLGTELNIPAWNTVTSILTSLFAIVFAVYLLKWKRWAFWGLVAVQTVSVILGIIGGNYFSIIGGVIAVGILFALLNIGGANKAWPQLE